MVIFSLQIFLYSITETLYYYFNIALTEWWKVAQQGDHSQTQIGSINQVQTVSQVLNITSWMIWWHKSGAGSV